MVDKLKPEVREAVEDLRNEMELCTFGISEQSSIETVITELLRLAEENETMGRALSKHVLRCAEFLQRAERAESELAALKPGIAEAPSGVTRVVGDEPYAIPAGKRVRLLLDE